MLEIAGPKACLGKQTGAIWTTNQQKQKLDTEKDGEESWNCSIACLLTHWGNINDTRKLDYIIEGGTLEHVVLDISLLTNIFNLIPIRLPC